MRSALVLAVILGGCVRPQLQPCGELLCPIGTVCVNELRCVEPSQITLCELAEDGSTCDGSGGPGRCLAGICERSTCGDGYLDTALREDCDGANDLTAQCVDFGFDLGAPVCAADCRYELDDCVRFGWRVIANAPTTTMWSDGSTLAYTHLPSGLVVSGPLHDIDVPDAYAKVVGGGGRVFAWSRDLGIVEAIGNSLEPIAPPPGEAITTVESDDQGMLYALVGCAVFRRVDAAWSQLAQAPASSLPCQTLVLGPTAEGSRVFVPISEGGDIYEVLASGWVLRVTSSTNAMVFGNGSLWITSHGGGLLQWSGGDTAGNVLYPEVAFPPTDRTTSVAVVGDAVYVTVPGPYVIRLTPGRVSALSVPSTGKLFADVHGDLYLYGSGPIVRFSGLDFGILALPQDYPFPSQPARIVDAVRGATEIFAISANSVFRLPRVLGSEWIAQSSPPSGVGQARAIAIGSRGLAFAGRSEQIATLNYAGLSYSPPGISPNYEDIVVSVDDTLFAVGSDSAGRGFLGSLALDVWTVTTTAEPCVVRSVHSRAGTTVAAGGCGGIGVVWRSEGAAWTELHREPATVFYGVITMDGDRMLAVGDNGLSTFDATSWSFDPHVAGRTLSGTRDDLWVSGAFTAIQHFDGTRWSQMTTAADGEIIVSAGDDRVLFYNASAGRFELVTK